MSSIFHISSKFPGDAGIGAQSQNLRSIHKALGKVGRHFMKLVVCILKQEESSVNCKRFQLNRVAQGSKWYHLNES